MAGLDIVIVNWNAGGQIRRCIESIAAADLRGIELGRIVVVDNASTDGSIDGLATGGLPLTVIRNAVNRGFAAACNQGAAAGSADYLLFLNPDTKLFADSLAFPVGCMERPEMRDTAAVGVQLVDERGAVAPSCSRFPTLGTLLSKALGLHRLSPRLFPTYAMGDWDHGESREVDCVMGAFFLVRRSAFDELGGFDERFFVYFEETDLARRMHEMGWKCRYLTGARAYHRGGGASAKSGGARLFYVAASRILYARKHFGPAAAGAYLAAALTLEPAARIIASAAPGAGGSPRETARAYGKLYRSLGRILKGLSIRVQGT